MMPGASETQVPVISERKASLFLSSGKKQGHVYAMVPQAEHSDQLDMQGTFYTCNCYLMHHVHYCILCDGFGLGS